MSERTPIGVLTRPNLFRRVATVIGVLLALVGTALSPGTVSAHTGFESSTPAEGGTIDQPVDLVTIVFTGAATPVGDEFIALTPDGVIQQPVSIETLDDKVFSVRFDPPLAGGQVGIRWNVKAADAHPIEGAFAFTVSAPIPTTVASATTTPPTTSPSTTIGDVVEPAPTPTADTTPAVINEAAPPADPSVASGSEVVAPSTQSLDEFLAIDASTPGETTAAIGRLIGFLGVALGLGAFAFVGTALRGSRGEIRQVLNAVRVLGLVIAVGAALEYVGVARIGGESLASGWSTSPGLATVLRVVGGVGLATGVAGKMSRNQEQPPSRPSVARSLSSAAVGDVAAVAAPDYHDGPIVRWTPDARSSPSLAGVVLIVMSFWFDGHTVSKGYRPLHDLANSVHVAAGAVWVGGVVTMAYVIWSRYRSGHRMRVVELVVRFSKIATIALASVVVAGIVMAFLVLDSFGELTGTPWGKILLLKTAAVGLAMVGGAYNHFRLLPALEADPDSPELLSELRSTVTAEAIVLVFVVIVTTWLVAAAS